MPLISVVKFVNWITGTPTTFEDGLVAALTAPLPSNLGTTLANIGIGLNFNCRLGVSGTALLLSPYNGNVIFVNGAPQSIPSSGVTLAATGLISGTFYYVYAFMSGTTMTLEASTTAPATHALGYKQKTGDATRTLVGAALVQSGPIFVDSSGSRFVMSWYNRRTKLSSTIFQINRAVNTASLTEVNTEIRSFFINWAEEDVYVSFNASIAATLAANWTVAATLDAGATVICQSIQAVSAGLNSSAAGDTSVLGSGLTETASHFITMANASGSTITYLSLFCQINVQVNS